MSAEFSDEDLECTALLAPLGFVPQHMGGNLVGYHIDGGIPSADCNELCGQLCASCGSWKVTIYAAECECLPIMGEEIVVWVQTPSCDTVRKVWASVASYVRARTLLALW